MKILFFAAEATPIIKVGGLADVVGALPKALAALGHDVRVLIPNYDAIDRHKFPVVAEHPAWDLVWHGQQLPVRVLEGRLPGAETVVYYLDCPPVFQTRNVLHGLSGVYANSNDVALQAREIERFVFFSLAGAEAPEHLDWQPDLWHCHDWHTALVPLMGQLSGRAAARRPTVLTIHNLQNQGRWPATDVFDWLGWSGRESPLTSRRDRKGNFNALQIGIAAATAVNTVSPTYAREILTPEFGEGLDKDLSELSRPPIGILNGIDTDVFDPATDPALDTRYDRSSWQRGKEVNKLRLQRRLGLTVGSERPLFVAVGRLTPQKGFDLVSAVAPRIITAGAELAILGSGLPEIEQDLHALAQRNPASVAVTLKFDPQLAQQLYAAADFFLMPSRFEPCGLGQMIAMRYGTLPIVRDTGGLHDSVIDAVAHPKTGTGFVFGSYDAAAFGQVIDTALQLHRRPDIVHIVEWAMVQDFSWAASARRYEQLYAQTLTSSPT